MMKLLKKEYRHNDQLFNLICYTAYVTIIVRNYENKNMRSFNAMKAFIRNMRSHAI